MSILRTHNKDNEKQNEKRGPVYMEDSNKFDGKSTFCNIEAFPRYGFQNFKKVKGSVRYKP